VLSGADDSSIAQAIIDADKMIHDPPGSKIEPPYTSPFLAPAVASALNTALTTSTREPPAQVTARTEPRLTRPGRLGPTSR
jgi:hypothetical protein